MVPGAGNSRHQRAGSVGFGFFDAYNDDFALSGASHTGLDDVSLDSLASLDSSAWDLFGAQSTHCIAQDQVASGAVRTPHDDLCAHPPKCPTASHLGNPGHNHNASHMLFHTRHFDPASLSTLNASLNAGFNAGFNASLNASLDASALGQPVSGPSQASMLSSLSGYNPGGLFSHGSLATSAGPSTALFLPEDFGEQLSALSSPPTRNSMSAPDGDDDCESVCNSDCDVGTICHDTVCSEDPSACCDDEGCFQVTDAPAPDAISSEDAIAAAALASFGERQRMQATQAAPSLHQSHQSHHNYQGQNYGHAHHNHSVSSASGTPCLPFGSGPDLCISPEFLMNFKHFQEAHNPMNPSACTEPVCPVEDPSFYQQCHIKHFADQQQSAGMFDDIDLDMMMSETQNHLRAHKYAVECGARFPDSSSMFEHLMSEHGSSLNTVHNSVTQHHGLGLEGSFATANPVSPLDVTTAPSFNDPLTLSGPFRFGMPDVPRPQSQHSHASPIVVPVMAQAQAQDLAAEAQCTGDEESSKTIVHECLWCDSIGSEPCKQVFGCAGDLHKHVLDTHTHHLKRGAGGMFSCGWHGCTRREGEEKSGFVQKSKVDRHMQVHTGNKPFTCNICHQSFSANQALVQHKLIHEDSKPLVCHICSKTFRQHSALTMHIRTHTKVRPLKCPYCSKEFSESSNLSKHKRIHAGDGQYVCKHPRCGRAFHRRDQLRRHSAQHTKVPGGRAEKSSLSPSPE